MENVIENLTPEQEAKIPIYKQMGLDIGLATGPCDREKTIKSIIELYKYVKCTPPKIFIFTRSPLEAQIVMNELTSNDPGEKKLNEHTDENNDEWVKNIIKTASHKEKYTFFSTHNYGYGSNEAFWISFYKYFKEVCNVKYEENSQKGLDIFDKLSLYSGWHYLFEECAIISDRADEIHIKNETLHNESGPAVSYSDGLKMWVIDGHVLNEQIVMHPETLTIDQMNSETNEETRRIMIERYGVDKYLENSDAKVLDSDRLSLEGFSLRTLIEDKHGDHWLIGTDGSTGRVYYMSAPSDSQTCKEAHEAMSGLPESKIVGEC